MFEAIKVFIASTLMAVVTLISGKPSTINPTPTPVSSFDEFTILKSINDYRSTKKFTPLNTDYDVCQAAQKILDKNFWKSDISLNDVKDVCPSCTALSLAESQYQTNVDTILSSWKTNKTTSTTILSNYKYGCVKTSGANVIFLTASKSSNNANTTNTNVNNNSATNTTPSRTGPIITYHEWCTQKDIKVYQNELITKKSSDGKTYSMTQGDWDCYEKYLAGKTTSNNPTTVNTYVPSTYVAPTYYPCTLYYPSLHMYQTYNALYKTKAECDAQQAVLNSTTTNTYVTIPTIAPAPVFRDYNDPVCQNIRNQWEQKKAAIGPLDGSNQNYSNSADMAKDYLYWKGQFNSLYSSNSCTGYLN